MIIGLSGYAQSGKDTLAKFLIEDYGFTRFAFADALRDTVYALNPVVRFEARVSYDDDPGEQMVRVQDIVDTVGWEQAKTSQPEIRRLLQAMGTEAGRKILGESIWVDTVFRQVQERGLDKVVITDCRFPNEAEAVKAQGGFVVRINRPGVRPVNNHPSEVSLDEWGFDYVVPNNDGLEELHSMAKYLHDELVLMQFHLDKLPSARLPGYGSPTAKVR